MTDLGETLVDLALTSLELLLALRSLAIEDGLVLGNQLLDARLLYLSLDTCEIRTESRDYLVGFGRIQLGLVYLPCRLSRTTTNTIKTTKRAARM